MTKRRIGIYGGSFDPIHVGHLLVAETCREQLGLDEVRLIPAHVSPFKVDQYPSEDKQRLEMLQLAVAGQESFVLDSREVERGGVSYTVETLRELHRELPDAELFLLMGADSLVDFLKWKEPEEICRLAWIVVVGRGGHTNIAWHILEGLLEPEKFQQTLSMKLVMPLIEISSTELRERAAAGRSLRFRMPRAVEQYIKTHQLYRSKT
jgi:nicotinate-nucleotide adenylyltransferase